MNDRVTKEQLDEALEAWHVAREGAAREMEAWRLLTQSHAALIASLRTNGHSWAQATAEFDKFSQEHRAKVLGTWEHMDARCSEYQALRARFNAQG